MRTCSRLAWWAAAAVLLVFSCKGFGPGTFTHVEIDTGPGIIFVGDTTQISAGAWHDNDTDVKKLFPSTQYPERYTWTSLNPGIASIDALGVVRGLDTGTVTIQVVYENEVTRSDRTAQMRVVPLVTTLQIQPVKIDLRLGDTISVHVTTLTPAQVSARTPYSITPPSEKGTLLLQWLDADPAAAPWNNTPATVKYRAVATGQASLYVDTKNNRADRILHGQVQVKVVP